MPDISMCINTECPLRQSCHRYTAIPSEYRQAYTTFKYRLINDNHIACDGFISNNGQPKKSDVAH